jgi:hypothetical protein
MKLVNGSHETVTFYIVDSPCGKLKNKERITVSVDQMNKMYRVLDGYGSDSDSDSDN